MLRSNIVALDVLRAARREAALEALLPELDAGPDWLRHALQQAAQFVAACAAARDEAHARQAATGLYYAVAAAVLWREGAQLAAHGDARRQLLAALVFEHRLRARDPLRAGHAAFETAWAEALLPETPVSPQLAQSLLESLKL